MNQLTFQTGTFAGQTIRTTPDGYASIYDIMRVAGVGKEPTHAWNAIKEKFYPTGSSPSTSVPRPLTKSFKFSGRGQRDTPVISGQGLAQLLFLLPGKRARQFVAESAEVLVRHIGGDETLIEPTENTEAASAQIQTAASGNAASFFHALRGDDGNMITEMRTTDGFINATKMCQNNPCQPATVNPTRDSTRDPTLLK